MRKYVAIATVLFLVHTIEEAGQSFWQTDFFSTIIANFLHSTPETVYWIGQLLLYLFLTVLFFAKETRAKKWGYFLLGVLLLLEMEHVIVSLQNSRYEVGLISGIALTLYGLFFVSTLRSKLTPAKSAEVGRF